MIKRIKSLFGTAEKLDEMSNKLNSMQDQLTQLSSVKRPTRYQEIPITEKVVDYESLKDSFNEKYSKDARHKYNGIKNNLLECILQYDKLLYFPKETINYIELTARIAELNILRNTIFNIIFGTCDITSFYLYTVNTQSLRYTITSLSFIDESKLFMMPYDSEVDVENYVVLNMQNDKIILTTPREIYELENKYRKTAIRVLYSLYTEKYYLYHLSQNKENVKG